MTAKCRSVYPKSQTKEAVEVVAHKRPKPRKVEQKALFPIVLALATIILAPQVAAQAQDGREEGPIEIEKCRTIDKPGSYKLVNNLTFTSTDGTCLLITADCVTIDLAGFTITGPGTNLILGTTTAIATQSSSSNLQGIAVRNGSISNFTDGVELSSADGSIVEALRVSRCLGFGISATGIVKGNTVVGCSSHEGFGISATGIVTGNTVSGSGTFAGMAIGQGSTVIGNASTNNGVGGEGAGFGIAVDCPSNVTDNTAVNNFGANLVLNGDGCTNTDNVAP